MALAGAGFAELDAVLLASVGFTGLDAGGAFAKLWRGDEASRAARASEGRPGRRHERNMR